MTDHRLQPVSDRLEHLDVLRGFALLGILLVNFEWFTRPIQAIVLGPETGLSGLDAAAGWFVQVFAEGKFYPLFSMLFGAGFALMFERAASRQAPFWGTYLRRLVFLALFGLGHMVLVWAGDILLVYALSAFVMVLLFRNTPARRLWKWALVFVFLPVLFIWLFTLSIEASRMDPETHSQLMEEFEQDEQALREQIAEAARIQTEGTWRENVAQRLQAMAFTLTNAFFWVPPLLGFFLLGRWLVVTDRLRRPESHRLWLRRWRSRGLLAGLPLAVLAIILLREANWMIPTAITSLGITLAAASGLLLSLAYLSLITLNAHRLRFLAPAGQMALTNYLAQSLFWTWMIYGHGAGLEAALPRSAQLILSLVFFACQVLVSHWWLARFRYGPAEWLWRTLTYWKAQPMSRTRS